MPRSIEHSKQLEKKNGNTFWIQALAKEIHNVSTAFELLEKGYKTPPGWKPSSGHIIFDVKMDFTQKLRWVKDGHKTPDPSTSNYSGVVLKDSVCIDLIYAALHDVDVTAADIQNAHLQAPSSKKHFIICGPKFVLEYVVNIALIRRALYRGKMAVRDLWIHLSSCMNFLRFKLSQCDPEVLMREAVKADGTQYWEYVLLYVDDCLVVSENGEKFLRNEIGKYFTLGETSIGPPKVYLGGKMSLVELSNGSKAWAFSSSQYGQEAVQNVESYLKEKYLKLPARELFQPQMGKFT